MLGEEERVDSSNLLRAAVAGVADTPPPAAAAAIREFWKPPYLAFDIGVAWTR